MPVSTSGLSVPQLSQGIDPSIYGSQNAPKSSSISDMLDISKKYLDLRKAKETYQPEIDYIKANAQQALNTFGQNYAQTAYTNAFNQYQTQRGNISAIDIANANLGLSGATGSANAQLGTATNIANLGIGSANAQAASQVAQGNVYGNAINTATGAGYSALSGMNGSLFGSTNNGGSYNDFGAGAGQSGNSGFTVSPNAPSGTSFQLA